jgi:hypothetical protein
MPKDAQRESAFEDKGNALSKEHMVLSSRLETYRWLFWAAAFVIMVLVVAQCAHHR